MTKKASTRSNTMVADTATIITILFTCSQRSPSNANEQSQNTDIDDSDLSDFILQVACELHPSFSQE